MKIYLAGNCGKSERERIERWKKLFSKILVSYHFIIQPNSYQSTLFKKKYESMDSGSSWRRLD